MKVFIIILLGLLLIPGAAFAEMLDNADALVEDIPEELPVSMYRLEIDVTNQVVFAYTLDENGEYTVLVREMICSTGTKSDPTPEGEFVMPDSKRYSWGYFPKFYVYAKYLVRIKGSILFHSVIYQKNKLSSLKTSSYNNLGSRASHGCIRLLLEDAKWIYDNILPGTVCRVYYGEADPQLKERLKPIPLNSWYPELAADPPATRNPLAYPTAASQDGDGDIDFETVRFKPLIQYKAEIE